MSIRLDFKEKLKWIAIAVVIGVLAGTASAIFLLSLEWATHLREQNRWLVMLLPAMGFAVGWLYLKYGAPVEGGNNLIIDEIHEPKAQVPLRMAPMVLLGTVLTHIGGGSAGREGTAVQMGGSLADQLAKPLRLKAGDRRTLLMAGMSAGFGSVFGVPLAGTFFGLEVLTIGQVRWRQFVECLIASFVGHYTCLLWRVEHTRYPAPDIVNLGAHALFWTFVAGVAFGVFSRVFVFFLHAAGALFKKYLPNLPLRSFTGGVLVVVGFYMLGTLRFAGLGVPVIVEALHGPVPEFDFAWKSLFTILTLGSGFKGGEVTPLLFIGATFGNSLGAWIQLPVTLLSAMGFVAVFAGAANTPWACTLMAMEIFGPQIGVFALIGCWMSFLLSSHHGIYSSQRFVGSRFLFLKKPKLPSRGTA